MAKLRSVLSVTGAALLLALLGSNAAHADTPPAPDESNVIDLSGEVSLMGNCDTVGPVTLCGRINNRSSSDDDLWIINNWPPETANGAFVPPGGNSTTYFRDTDGVYIPTGCKGVRSLATDLGGGYWYKISNGQTWTIDLQC
ncbi:hypothetical protein [Streptosporangium sp. NPDC048865]|uniref:hypothetical protein n=1 Tax=Streptosporangium sp. NPDC048865 TaxID=3155766 RepID=UPI00342B9ABD